MYARVDVPVFVANYIKLQSARAGDAVANVLG